MYRYARFTFPWAFSALFASLLIILFITFPGEILPNICLAGVKNKAYLAVSILQKHTQTSDSDSLNRLRYRPRSIRLPSLSAADDNLFFHGLSSATALDPWSVFWSVSSSSFPSFASFLSLKSVFLLSFPSLSVADLHFTDKTTWIRLLRSDPPATFYWA